MPRGSASWSGRLAAALVVGAVLLTGCGKEEQPPPRQPARARPADQHATHGAPAAAASKVKPTGVLARRAWVDPAGNRFTVWVAFGPPANGGVCALGGYAEYSHSMLLMVQSDPRNRPAAGPRIGAKAHAVAFPHGDNGCSWDYAETSRQRFAPGDTKTFTGLVRTVPDDRKGALVLTVGPANKPTELVRIPYRSF
jgi:hypothetical protein